jgi:hypothetical protein
MRDMSWRTLRVERLDDRLTPAHIAFTPFGQVAIVPIPRQPIAPINPPELHSPPAVTTTISGIIAGISMPGGHPGGFAIQSGPPIVVPGTGAGIPIPRGNYSPLSMPAAGIPIPRGNYSPPSMPAASIPIPAGRAGGIPIPMGGPTFATPLAPVSFTPPPAPSIFAPAGLGMEIPPPSWTLVSPIWD